MKEKENFTGVRCEEEDLLSKFLLTVERGVLVKAKRWGVSADVKVRASSSIL